MDSYRDFPSDFEPASEVAGPDEPTVAAIGSDERRMHVRAYNYWVSLLDGRDYPSIEDLEPGDLVDFAPHSVLLDFTSGRDDPATPYIGVAIRAECDLDDEVRTIADVPSRSLLSRLTDHYMQIIANRAPVGFEAEFVHQRGDNLCYRGILMPFSSDESAEAVKAAESRSRDALYRALASAYDFALASKHEPEAYAELLEESGVKAQARAPMTPIVKLVFGIDHDKSRLTEYAAALSYAERMTVEAGGFLALIDGHAGGLKSLVAAERQARRPEPKPDTKTEKARERLRSARPLSLDELPADDEFALVLTRRSDSGGHEVVAVVGDPALVERAIRRSAA